MIILDFNIKEEQSKIYRGYYQRLETVSETEARYYLFHGGFTMILNGCDLSANWGWIPILDFSSCLYWCAMKIRNSKENVFEFTESDEKIYFVKSKENVKISSDYAECEAEVNYESFIEAVEDFSQRVILQISKKYPRFKNNKEVWKWYSDRRALALLSKY